MGWGRFSGRVILDFGRAVGPFYVLSPFILNGPAEAGSSKVGASNISIFH